ncbi:MAG: hypothetical protein OXF02_00050 [Simkaniaceae bacterium]|nr:hypothetical protein [Simkaniaceae bacterium]
MGKDRRTTTDVRYREVALSWLFAYPFRCFALADPTSERIFLHDSTKIARIAATHRYGCRKHAPCRVTHTEEEAEEITGILLVAQEELAERPEQCDLFTAEILAKMVAYHEWHRGETLSVPCLNKGLRTRMHLYTINKVFRLWHGMRAFGLISRDGAPLLLFRGTDLSLKRKEGRASIISTLDPGGPGRTVFEEAEKELKVWLRKVTAMYGKARAIGHSLGGAIASYVILRQRRYFSFSPHSSSYSFNAPGIPSAYIETDPPSPPDEMPTYRGFISRGDVISKFGTLFGNITELSLRSPLLPIEAHERLMFAEPELFLRQVDLSEENSTYSRYFYSRLKQHASSALYEWGLRFLLG